MIDHQTEPPAAGQSPTPWAIVGLLMALSFTNYVNRISITVAGDEIRDTYGLTETQFGTVISAFIFAYTIFMTPAGWLSDRFGGRAALTAMGLGTAVFTAVTGGLGWVVAAGQSATMLASLWVVRAAMGAFSAPLYPAAGRVVAGWIPLGRRARANALVTGAGMLGMAVCYPLFGILMNRTGWPAAFLTIATMTAILALVWAVVARDGPAQRADAANDRPSRSSWAAVLPNRSLWVFTLSYATVGYVEYVVWYWSEHYLKNVLEFGETAGRLAAMLPPLCTGLCMPLGGWLSDWLLPRVGYRRCRAWVAMGGMVGCAAMLMWATLATNNAVIVACFAIGLGLMGLTEAPAWATAIDLGGKQAATSAAIANTGGNAGGVLSPTVTPWVSAILVAHYGVSESEGWAWGIRLAAVVCLFGAVLWLWIDAAERHDV
jgi:MFS family permease